MKLKNSIVLFIALILPALLPANLEQEDRRSVAPGIYLDCQARDCDLNYIRKEISFVNYVRDRENADVHILITTQPTGAGGKEYTMAFIGLGRHKDRDTQLKYFSLAQQSADELRKGIVNLIKKGLLPYLYDTPLSEFISVSYDAPGPAIQSKPHDPWNYWVFNLGLRGYFNLESQFKRYNYNLSLSANRTTEKSKFVLWINGNFDNRSYLFPGEEDIKSRTERKTVFSRYVKSLGGHWAAGLFFHIYASTYDNAALFASIGPGVEFNFFPYEEATRRELRFQYRLNLTARKYIEETVYDKLRETLLNQSFSVIFELKEPWGNVGILLEGSNYLHDFSKNKIKIESGISLRISRGLSGNLDIAYSRVGDQLALPKTEASIEERLLELKRLATNYNLQLRLGLSFSFGSIYSNVVNSRFGNY